MPFINPKFVQNSNTMLKKSFYLFLILGVSLILFSCNSEKKDSDSSNQTEEVSADEEEVTIHLKSNDQMQFDKKEIEVYEGQKVTLKLEHIGEMPKTSMGHNFVLLDPETSPSSYSKKAAKAKDNDYIPEDENLTLAHTKMIGGGEQTEVTFEAPEKGDYDFICSFPGHYSNMKGKFIIK